MQSKGRVQEAQRMLKLSQMDVLYSDSEIDSLRDEFAQRHCILLPHLIDAGLLSDFLRQVDRAAFAPKKEGAEGDEFGDILFVPVNDPALFVFHLMMNNQKLFQVIQRIAGCDPIGNFFGRIHRSVPGRDHQISWHGDNADHRLVGITIELSREAYTGGAFQVRYKDSDHILTEITETRIGDAFLFRIDPRLQHRLLAVESGGSRTVAVGWFRSAPNWQAFAKIMFKPESISRSARSI